MDGKGRPVESGRQKVDTQGQCLMKNLEALYCNVHPRTGSWGVVFIVMSIQGLEAGVFAKQHLYSSFELTDATLLQFSTIPVHLPDAA